MKTPLKRFVIVPTNHNKMEVYCTSIRFHDRSLACLGSIIDPKTCPNETRWPYHMKSKTFSCLISTIESPSLSQNIQKNKNILVILYFTRTRKLNVTFPILSLKVDHLGTFVIKPNFNILCLPGPTWNWNEKLKSLYVYSFDRDHALLSYNYTKLSIAKI